MMKKNIKYLAVLALGFIACEPEFDTPLDESIAESYSSGSADFSTYVSLGNSLTAGYADDALYISGQENSYPNILAQQFALVGGGDFTQPLMNDNVGGLLVNGTQILENRLVLAVGEDGSPGPSRYTGGTATTDVLTDIGSSFNNMGVPGAKSFHLVADGYGSVDGVALGLANPFYARFASSASTNVIADAVAQNPTFFTLWIGSNDVLGYATSGGTGVDQNAEGNLDPTTYASNDITNANVFGAVYDQILSAMTANEAKGVLINLPSVTSIPFFTTVPYAPLSPLDESFAAQIPSLNETYAGLNAAFAAVGVGGRAIEFSTTAASPVVIKDETLTDVTENLALALAGTFGPLAPIIAAQYGQARQATENDLLLLTSSGVIGQVDTARVEELVALGVPVETAGQLSVTGLTLPMDDQYVLTSSEQTSISNALSSYNATIDALGAAYGLPVYDAAADLELVATTGYFFEGGILTSEFATGGAFSLDGVHPTPRAHAFTANAILDVIKTTYDTELPRVDLSSYGTVTFSDEVN